MTTIASTLRNLVAATALLGLATLAAHAATETPPGDALATVNALSVDEPTTTETPSGDALAIVNALTVDVPATKEPQRAAPLDLTARPVPTCSPRRC